MNTLYLKQVACVHLNTVISEPFMQLLFCEFSFFELLSSSFVSVHLAVCKAYIYSLLGRTGNNFTNIRKH